MSEHLAAAVLPIETHWSHPPMPELSAEALSQLFGEARTLSSWQDLPVDDATLKRLYELTRLGPTSANSSPMRVVFVNSSAAKARLLPALNPGNVDKTMQAPVTAIIARDTAFLDRMPQLVPGRDAKGSLSKLPPEKIERMGVQSATLEAGYLILAARALGLDCGPMGGFDGASVDEAFFSGSTWRSELLINLGYGDRSKLQPRLPRLDFSDAARIE